MWEAFVINLVISALVYILTPKPPSPPTPTAGTLEVPSPKLGTNVPVVFGEVWIDDAAISYYGNSATEPIKSKGGK